MSDSRHSSYNATPADMQFAADYNAAERRAGPVDVLISDEQLAAEMHNDSGTLTLPSGATLGYSEKQPARTLQVGEGDPTGYLIETRLDALANQADYLLERLATVSDPATGGPRSGYETDHRNLVLRLHSVQRAAAYEKHITEARLRAQGGDERSGLSQLIAESAHQDRRTGDANARALDEMFGKVKII